MFPQIFGKYVLDSELAAGGMARVYVATLRGAVGFEKRLVVKQIRPELSVDEAFVRRFVEEAKIAVELSHPNIVPVYELGVEQGIYYIAMELCVGLTLTEILTETGPLDAAEGAYVGIEICRALDYAHRRGGIVHRDVTPRNVLLDEEGAVRLIDFGIAAPVSRAEDSARIEVFGSPGHMPPEQLRGEPLTPATDVFAVGVLLVEAWTGRPPFRRGSFEASARALNEPRGSLGLERPDLSPIAEVIGHTLALSAAERPQQAEALARKLRDFSRPFDSGDVAQRLGARVRRARRRAQSSIPWLPGETSGPLTPARVVPRGASSRPPPRTPATPPMPPLTPATSPSGEPVTRTFAARDDLVEWTRKLGSVAPLPPEPESSRGSEPATKPLSRVAVATGVGVVALLALFGSRVGDETRASVLAVRSRSLASSLGSPAGRSTPEPAGVLPPDTAPVAMDTAQMGVKAARSAGLKAAGAPAASASLEQASLRMTADPQATVTIVGGRVARTEVTPVRGLKLPPGVYSVTFRSPTFGEPVVARVELVPGASRSVHADFRAALPTVAVR